MSGVFTVIAPVNIAVIKYWGKRDEELIIPLNDSVSATLDTKVMCAKTSVCASPDFAENEIWLNGKKESFSSKRLQSCLVEIRRRANKENTVDSGLLSWNIRICSVNNFPTAAGLASSAAGYACLVTALAKLYNIKSDVSSIARVGSGSACRSVYGGFVRWHAGVNSTGNDSVATQIVGSSHWPELKVLILVVHENKKSMSSTDGMRISAKTSELLQHRIQYCVPNRTRDIIEAIKHKDFAKFGEITMKDSNQFHAICQDSYPPFVYLNDVSQTIIKLIHNYNNICGDTKVAYTFDAGPNACLYLLQEEVPKILGLIKHVFPTTKTNNYVTGLDVQEEPPSADLLSKITIEKQNADLIKYIIHTRIGEGPTQVTDGSDLLDEAGVIKTVNINN